MIDFIEVSCVSCGRHLWAAADLSDTDLRTLECIKYQPALYPTCMQCDAPLYAYSLIDAPDYCPGCQVLASFKL